MNNLEIFRNITYHIDDNSPLDQQEKKLLIEDVNLLKSSGLMQCGKAAN